MKRQKNRTRAACLKPFSDLSFPTAQGLPSGRFPADLDAINPDLTPLIAHDRAGFGGALFLTGLALLITLWNAPSSRSLWQMLGLTGSAGFLAVIGIHFIVGYTDFVHLFPAFLGVGVLFSGLALTARGMYGRKNI